jgi:hypothetical protein
MRRTTFRLTQLETRDTPVAGFSAFGAAPGGLPLVAVLRPDGTALAQFSAFEDSFRGGVRTAVGELDGDPNTQEVVVGAGVGGGPAVKLYSVDVNSGAVLPRTAFFAFEDSFRGGVRVAVGSVAGQGDSIIVGAGEGGGPRVRVLDASGNTRTGSPLADFFAFEESFRGGVQVSAGELDGNPATGDELVVAAGTGGGPRVRVIRSDGAVLADYFAFNSTFRGGANVAVETTGGAVDRIRADALALDPSQRNTALNNTAFTAANPATGTAQTGTGFNSGVNGFTGVNGLGGVNTGFGSNVGIGSQTTNLTGVNTGLGTTGFNTGIGTGVTGQTGIANGVGGVGGIGTTNTGVTGVSSGVFGQSGVTSGVTGQTGITSGIGGIGGVGTTTGVGGIGSTTTAGGIGNTTGVGGIGNTTGVGGIGSATNAGGITSSTGVNNLGTGGIGFGNTSLATGGNFTTNNVSTGVTGTTGAATGFTGLTGPISTTAFGPFGDPGQVIATPTLFTPAFAPGLTRYTITV